MIFPHVKLSSKREILWVKWTWNKHNSEVLTILFACTKGVPRFYEWCLLIVSNLRASTCRISWQFSIVTWLSAQRPKLWLCVGLKCMDICGLCCCPFPPLLFLWLLNINFLLYVGDDGGYDYVLCLYIITQLQSLNLWPFQFAF